jgi:hypothetical protein
MGSAIPHFKKLQVIYPGDKSYALSENVLVTGLEEYLSTVIKA